MMLLAVKAGHGALLVPVAYRAQFARRGFVFREPPGDHEEVSVPTPLAQATKKRPQGENEKVIKRRRRRKKNG